MKKHIGLILIGFAAVGVAAFTDINSAQYYGKTSIPKTYAVIDANFALLESGGVDANVGALTVNDAVTAISTNGATTNVIVTVNGALDGETLADDSVDDDAIDFADVTGADLTLTDCVAVTASGAVYGATIGFGAATGYFSILGGTNLVFIDGAVTNVIDADTSTP